MLLLFQANRSNIITQNWTILFQIPTPPGIYIGQGMMLRLRKTESETIILTLSNSNLAHHECKLLDLNFQSQPSSRAVGSEEFSRPKMMALLPRVQLGAFLHHFLHCFSIFCYF